MTKDKEPIIIDCLGDMCPVPMLKFRDIRECYHQGKCIKIITDHSCASENIINYCKENKYSFHVVEPMPGIWEIFLAKKETP